MVLTGVIDIHQLYLTQGNVNLFTTGQLKSTTNDLTVADGRNSSPGSKMFK